MKTVESALGVELVEADGTALLVLGHQVEGSQTLQLDFLRLKQHLHDTCLSLGEHTLDDILGVDRSVLREVLGQFAGVQRLGVNDSTIVLAISRTLVVLVLINVINDF